MTRLFPTTVRRTTVVAGGGPTVTVVDRAGYQDSPGLTMRNPDSVGFEDRKLLVASVDTEMAGWADALNLTGTPQFTETVGARDTLTVDSDEAAFFRAAGHGAAGDSDPWGDAWTDGTVGQTGVNHGDTDTLTISALTSLNRQYGYFEIDLTRFQGFTSSVGGVSLLTLRAAQSGLVAAANLRVYFSSVPTRPFTESTVTAAAPPTPGTLQVNVQSFAIAPGGGFQTVTVPIPDAALANFVGKWMLVGFAVNDLDLETMSVHTREHATPSERPNLHLRYRE